MAQSESKYRAFLKQHKTKLQAIALGVILIIPFLLYVLAQGGQIAAVTTLIVVMAILMIGIVVIS
jgi:hypothetical protein